MKNLIEITLQNPRKLFLLDGFGALLSSFLLGCILTEFENIFGIPKPTLYLLALIPIFFVLYDAFFYFKKNTNINYGLKGIAILNFSYCIISIFYAFFHIESITFLGWFYIFIEIIIVSLLAIFELIIAKRI